MFSTLPGPAPTGLASLPGNQRPPCPRSKWSCQWEQTLKEIPGPFKQIQGLVAFQEKDKTEDRKKAGAGKCHMEMDLSCPGHLCPLAPSLWPPHGGAVLQKGSVSPATCRYPGLRSSLRKLDCTHCSGCRVGRDGWVQRQPPSTPVLPELQERQKRDGQLRLPSSLGVSLWVQGHGVWSWESIFYIVFCATVVWAWHCCN